MVLFCSIISRGKTKAAAVPKKKRFTDKVRTAQTLKNVENTRKNHTLNTVVSFCNPGLDRSRHTVLASAGAPVSQLTLADVDQRGSWPRQSAEITSFLRCMSSTIW